MTDPVPSCDVLIVGARVAGAATAMLLARRGLRVLVVDREGPGRDTLSTHALMRGGVRQLHRWGVLPAVVAAGTPAVRTTWFHYGDETVEVPIKPRDGIDALYAPRRTVLDPILVAAARAAGAGVQHGVRLRELVRDARGRVRGAIVADGGGQARAIRAGLVVGADGLHSTVARLVGAEPAVTGAHAAAFLYGHWPGVDVGGYRWFWRPGVSAGAIPTNDGETCIFVSATPDRLRAISSEGARAGYHRLLAEAAPELAGAVARSPGRATIRGFHGARGHLRPSAGDGWALVGDAAFFRDPLTSHGMTDALRDAELLAHAVAVGSPGALAEYAAASAATALPILRLSDDIASFAWDLPRVRELHRVLAEEMKKAADVVVASLAAPSALDEST
jgi:2-polyprenyl-6-methoxyphenol hydroxylase-like FAD-dependent oxidoreductase